MTFRRRRLMLSAALALPLWVHAFDLLEGHDYRVIPQQPLADPKRVEVVEFFYYGCQWCFQLEPYLENWLHGKPAAIAFRRIPALRNTRWITLTRAYYAFAALGMLSRLHPRAYAAYHREEINLEDEEKLFQWVAKQGIAKAHFELVYRSDKVTAAMLESRELTAAYEIETTPTIVVDGRYLTSTGMAGGVAEVVPILDQLVELARQQRTGLR